MRNSPETDVRILVLLTDGFGGHGGIAKFNRDLLRALAGHPRCERVTAVPRLAPGPVGELPARVEHILDGLGGKLKYGLTVVGHAKRDINMVVCAHINLLPLAWLCARRARVPLLLIVHGIEAWKPTRSRIVNILAKQVDAVVAVSQVTLERFRTWSQARPDHSYVLPNCVELERFTPGPKNADLVRRYGLDGKDVIMTLGRLDAHERYKGIDEVIEALPDLAKSFPKITYLIAGDGTDRDRLRRKADTAGLNGRVIFTGHVAEGEKVDHYRLADAYVMPGRGEGFGIVYLEAMACGVPVVASSADASREAVREGKLGLVVDPDKPEQIKMGIAAALKTKAGQAPDGLDYFSYGNFERRCHGILDSVVSGVRSGGGVA
jgi:phosphatidyl-myo-inositol dimannoside synthase